MFQQRLWFRSFFYKCVFCVLCSKAMWHGQSTTLWTSGGKESERVIDFSLCTNTVVPDTEWRGVGRTCTCNLTQTLWTLNWSSSLFLLSLIRQHSTSSVASVCRLLRLCSYFLLFVFFCSSSIYFPPLSPLIIFGRNSGFIIQPHLCQEGSHTAVEPSTLGS